MPRGPAAHSPSVWSFQAGGPQAASRTCLLALAVAVCGLCSSGRLLLGRGPAVALSKKGVGVWYEPGVKQALQLLGVSWFYTWKASAAAAGIDPPPGVEHVPMIWSAHDATPESLAAAASEPGTGALLGFNEPDNADQAAMSVKQALALWPSLAATGRRLGSPAVAKDPAVPGGWLDRFISGADAAGHPPDFIAVHYYGEDPARWDVATAVLDMKRFLERVHSRYGRPIWVTEWALVRWHPFPSLYPPPSAQAEFAEAAAAMMNALPWVERYAFFALWPYSLEAALAGGGDVAGGGRGGFTSQLFEKDGSLTAVGRAYRKA